MGALDLPAKFVRWCCSITAAGAVISLALVPIWNASNAQSNAETHAAASPTVTLAWENVPLRNAVVRLDGATSNSIFLDRRVDPNRRVTIALDKVTPQQALAALAAKYDLDVSPLGKLYYLGPAPHASELPTLVAARDLEISRLSPSIRRAFRQSASTEWPRLAEAREIIVNQIDEAGLQVVNSERIPLDIWDAGQLPRMTLTQRLTVLLAGFDLSFQPIDGRAALELIDVNRPVSFVRRYDVPQARRANVAEWIQVVPQATLLGNGRGIELRGRWEDHVRLQSLLSKTSKTNRRRGPQQADVFTLKVREQTVGVIIEQLANRLELDVEIDAQVRESLDQPLDRRVSFSVERVNLDALMQAILEPVGLSSRRQGDRLFIQLAE